MVAFRSSLEPVQLLFTENRLIPKLIKLRPARHLFPSSPFWSTYHWAKVKTWIFKSLSCMYDPHLRTRRRSVELVPPTQFKANLGRPKFCSAQKQYKQWTEKKKSTERLSSSNLSELTVSQKQFILLYGSLEQWYLLGVHYSPSLYMDWVPVVSFMCDIDTCHVIAVCQSCSANQHQ